MGNTGVSSLGLTCKVMPATWLVCSACVWVFHQLRLNSGK
ncbi:Uncharacterised protein [Vibrio cholerae]|nr:Uncharacterised protein [Vibrio cholerae]